MRMYDIILKKRNGGELTKEEIDFFVQNYTSGVIPDYQVSALLMAIYFRGMNKRETSDLTISMVNSGEKLDLSSIKGFKVDKHSTGGVGDKTSLVVEPMVASCGVPIAKMSGRGLGHTGGTIDKLESIKGFSAEMSKDEFIRNVNKVGLAIGAQTGNLVPADKKLYALRDVTGTVDNISLIASSIMSKKIACGADAIVLDVKVGSGAFMKTIDDSFKLASTMVDIGTAAGKKTIAIISDMDQPLGYAVGNSLEVKEAIEALHGKGPDDLMELCMCLGSHMLTVGGYADTTDEAEDMLKEAIHSGAALKKFKEFVKAQGGDDSVVDNTDMLPKSKYSYELKSGNDGYVKAIQAEEVGESSLILGAGRETKESSIDFSVGIILHKKVGDSVKSGESIATIYGNSKEKIELCKDRLYKAFEFSSKPSLKHKVIYGIVTEHGKKIY
jgi:pyrimidine-nucleoside phosphorylase